MNNLIQVPSRYRLRAPMLALAWVLLISGSLFAQSDGPMLMSRSECIDYALKNHPDIQNATFDEAIAQAKVKELVGVGLPQLSGSVAITDNQILPTSVVPADQFIPFAPEDSLLELKFGVKWQASAGVSVSQLLFDGSFFVGLQAARKLKELTVRSSDKTREDVASNVSNAYFTALISEERMNVLTINIKRLKELETNTRALYENGFAEKIDVDRITINLQNLRTELQKVRNMVDLSKNLLAFQMGMDVGTEIVLTDTLDRPEDLPEVPNIDLDADWHKKRIEYDLLTMRYELQELNLKRYKMSRLPSAGLYANFAYQAPRTAFNFFDFDRKWYPYMTIGLQINVPIWDGGQTKGKMIQTEGEIMKIENNMLQFERAVSLEIRNANTSLVNNYMTLKSTKETLDLAREVYRVTQIKFEEGVGSNLEVLEAESTLRESETNYLSALYEYMLAQTDLEKAKGEFLSNNDNN